MNIVSITTIFMTTIMIMILPQLFDYDNVFAEMQSKSVSDESLEKELRILRGDKAHAYEGLKKVCDRYKNVPFPANDKPTAKAAAFSLNNCSSYELYYGINQPADPVKARLCAYDEMDKEREESPHAGIGTLIEIYTNGVGAKRNLPLAIKLACEYGETVGDIERRIAHLELLKKQNWSGNDFSICDDAEGNRMLQYCSLHFETLSKIKREAKLKSMQTKWTSKEISGYTLLRKAASRYFNAHADKEFDENGHESEIQSTVENTALEEGFLSLLQEIHMGELPKIYNDKFEKTDVSLNSVYKKVIREIDSGRWGTVSKEDIKVTQREWIRYRDAWVLFYIKKYPSADLNSLKTRLTEERTAILRQFID